jgi:SAM-dependent methyltransferase
VSRPSAEPPLARLARFLRREARYRAGRLRRLPLRVRHRGAGVTCPVCLGAFASFVPAGPQRPWARCPRCGLLERHRGLFLYLEWRTDLFSAPRSLLHVAPEPELQRRLRARTDLRYVSLDLGSPYADVRGDLEALPFADHSFDAVLCSHVLEHVGDDRRALSEIRRVLRPGGLALLLVPVDDAREHTYEDATIVAPEARRIAFGQEDHLRQYGRDFAERVRAAGFAVEPDRWLIELDEPAIRRYGLGTDVVYRATPSGASA